MNLMNKLTIKNLKLNKKRTIMTVIGIMLSVALLTAVATMFFSAKASMILYQKQEQGNYHYGFDSVPKEDIEKLKQHRKIETLYITNILGYAKLDEDIETPSQPYAYVKEYTLEALQNLAVNLIQGRYPENSSEIVIPSDLKGNGGLDYKVGDTITLEIGTRVSNGYNLNQYNPYNEMGPEELVNTQTKTYTIVGIMESLPYRLESYNAPGYVFASYLENVDSIQTADVYIRYIKEALRDHYRITAQILNVDEAAFDKILRGDTVNMPYTEYEQLQSKIANPKYDYVQNDYLLSLESGILGHATLKAIATAAVIVVCIIIGTSVFCIKNSFDISITEKIRQYGMLASIGATKKQIRKNVYFEAILLGLMGIPLGVLSGVLAAFILILISNQLVSGILGYGLIFSFSWIAILFSVLLGFVTILLSAQQSARKASKIAPIQAIRNSTEIKIRQKDIKSTKWVKKIFGIGGEVSYKNLQRSRRKYRATVISIVICVSIFIALSSFVSMLYKVLQTEYQEIDYNIQALYYGTNDLYSSMDEIRRIEGIQFATDVSYFYISYETDSSAFTDDYRNIYPNVGKESVDENGNTQKWVEDIYTYVIDDFAFQTYVESLHLDYDKVKDKAILINTFFHEYDSKKIEMEMYTFQKGDVLDAYTSHYDSKEEILVYSDIDDIEIALVTSEVPRGVPKGTNETCLIVGEHYYDQLVTPYNNHTETLFIDSNNTSQTQEDLELLFNALEGGEYHINNLEENAKQMHSFYLLISIFLYGFITVIALIGVTNIFNTITTNMNLRRREFAMLRSIGMTTKEFNRMIQLESFFYGMKALLIGVPMGCILSYIIYKALIGGQVILAYQIPLQAILISAACVFLLVTVIMKYSLGKISQQNTIETIRNENI